jgi:hypothetical protein
MNETSTKSSDRDIRNRRNTLRLGFWTSAWVMTLALAVFGPKLVWEAKILTLATILLNVVIGAGMIVANKQHLDGLDELQRKIQLEAMALALGAGLVGGMAYSTMDVTDLIPGDAEISFLVMLIAVTYIVGIYLGRRKYQ